MPALRRHKQAELCEFEASVVRIEFQGSQGPTASQQDDATSSWEISTLVGSGILMEIPLCEGTLGDEGSHRLQTQGWGRVFVYLFVCF